MKYCLTKNRIKDISICYATTDKTMTQVGQLFGCSRYFVEEAIRRAIIEAIVDMDIVGKIMEKSDFNTSQHFEGEGKIVPAYYSRLIAERFRLERREEIEFLEAKLEELNFQLSSSDSYSSEDMDLIRCHAETQIFAIEQRLADLKKGVQ